MRTINHVALGLTLWAGAAGAAAGYQFSIRVNVDTAPAVLVQATLTPGTNQELKATDHLYFQIDAPSTVHPDSVTVVRLIDDSSGEPRVMHTARMGGPINQVRDITYALCAGKVKFLSPSTAHSAPCGEL